MAHVQYWRSFRDEFPSREIHKQIIIYGKIKDYDTGEMSDYMAMEDMEYVYQDEDGVYTEFCSDGDVMTHWMTVPEIPKN